MASPVKLQKQIKTLLAGKRQERRRILVHIHGHAGETWAAILAIGERMEITPDELVALLLEYGGDAVLSHLKTFESSLQFAPQKSQNAARP